MVLLETLRYLGKGNRGFYRLNASDTGRENCSNVLEDLPVNEEERERGERGSERGVRQARKWEEGGGNSYRLNASGTGRADCDRVAPESPAEYLHFLLAQTEEHHSVTSKTEIESAKHLRGKTVIIA